MEWLRDAWTGWQEYMDHGKLAALFLLALLYLAAAPGRRSAEMKRLRIYGIVTAALCICPLTAVLLLWYQTRFYNYVWLWSIVPVTAVTALGLTLFVTEWKKPWKRINNICYNIVLIGMMAAILILCGRLGEDTWESQSVSRQRAEAESVLSVVSAENGGEGICLWAPREVLEYARAFDGKIRLLYGRNMWDTALNAYCYDTYGEEQEALYQWMERAAETGWWSFDIGRDAVGDVKVTEVPEGETADGVLNGTAQMACALRLGADHILLRDNLSETSVVQMKAFAEAKNLEVQRIDGYYLLRTR